MDKLLTIYEQDINPDAPTIDVSDFREREAARAVVYDGAGRVALLHVGKHGYYKLPGGGIDPGEDEYQALEREAMEEIGCKVEVEDSLGLVVEFRNQFKLKQTSHCFIARQVGYKCEPKFTQSEINDEFSMIWAENINQAIEMVEGSGLEDYGSKFMVKRDLAILNTAKNKLAN